MGRGWPSSPLSMACTRSPWRTSTVAAPVPCRCRWTQTSSRGWATPIGFSSEAVHWLEGQPGYFPVKADGTELVPVSPDMGDDLGDYQAPAVAPDGQRVAFSAFDQAKWQSPTVGSPAGDWSGNLLQIHVLDLIKGTESVI